ncbi:uncharacterized protein A4U43_C01F3770 [Asparagus officinalis]|uniref:Uncharacterized protein n=1 Tax=Asparagus officinalis TaxID=4686 RepID=A0A5P1FN78_ASPOF|nr:uncharacterized protein A4U43_C01F3770 [Asparagus officinalis]
MGGGVMMAAGATSTSIKDGVDEVERRRRWRRCWRFLVRLERGWSRRWRGALMVARATLKDGVDAGEGGELTACICHESSLSIAIHYTALRSTRMLLRFSLPTLSLRGCGGGGAWGSQLGGERVKRRRDGGRGGYD